LDKQEREHLIVLGKQARDVMENAAFKTAVEQVMWDLQAQFLSTNAEEASTRERIWATGQALSAVRNKLDQLVQTGHVEERNKALDAEQ